MSSFTAGSMPGDHSAGAFLLQLLGGDVRHLTTGAEYRPDRYGLGIGAAITTDVYEHCIADAFVTLDRFPERNPDKRKS